MAMMLNQLQEFKTLGMSGPHLRAVAPIHSQYADDPDFAELIEFFVEAMPERMETLQLQLQERNLEQVRTIAHQLKGAGGGYGFDCLSVQAAELEQACLRGEWPVVVGASSALLDVMKRISV
jgi:HPt (histidine-containing phosphotransfer) domain-containing protein